MRWKSVASGVVYGALLYAINLHVLAPLLFPWTDDLSNWISFIAHLLFGLVPAYVYKLAQAAQEKSLEGRAKSTY